MSTFGDIKDFVQLAVAMDDDTAIAVIEAAINYAVVMAALTFDPPELSKVSSDIILTGGSNSMTLPNLYQDSDIDEDSFLGLWEIDDNGDLMPIDGETLSTHCLDIIKIYNDTDSFKVDFVPYEQWDYVVPSSLTDTRYWTIFGNTLFFKSTPTANTSMTFSYRTYPVTLENDGDAIPFDHFDSYLISSATGITMAAFEETDSAALWSKVAAIVGEPLAVSPRARAIVEGQKVMLESALAQTGGTV